MEPEKEIYADLTDEKFNNLLQDSQSPMTNKVTQMKVSDLFVVPETTQFKYATFTESFEKYKVKVDLLKWLVGTVGLTLITYIINWGFQDRAQGMEEISQYDKYASELIVLNDNPVTKRMPAQFFSNVTPSEKLKKGWKDYYREVDAEYRQFLEKDSIIKERLKELIRNGNMLQSSSDHHFERSDLEIRIAENEMIKRASIIIPDNVSNASTASNSMMTSPTFQPPPTISIKSAASSASEAEHIKALLVESGFEVSAIDKTEQGRFALKDNEIRYFWDSDFASVVEIKRLLSKHDIAISIQYLPRLASAREQGAIELWMK